MMRAGWNKLEDMYQFSVKNPTGGAASLKLLRKYSGLGFAAIKAAMSAGAPIISLDYRDDLEEMEIPQWCEKVKSIHNELQKEFETVTIGYSPAKGDEIEIVDESLFLNLLESECRYTSVHE